MDEDSPWACLLGSINVTRGMVATAPTPPSIRHFNSPLLSRCSASLNAGVAGLYHGDAARGHHGPVAGFDLGRLLPFSGTDLFLDARVCVCVQGCVCTPKEGGGATEWWWWWWEHSLHGSLYVHVVFVSRVHSSRHTWNPPPSPTPYPVLAGLLRCISQTPTEATARRKGSYGCTVPAPASGRVHHPWFACPPASLHPGMGTTRVHAAHAQGRGKGGLCAPRHACCPSIPPSRHPVAPLPSPPPTQHEPVLHRFFCCVRSSKDAAQRAVAHRSALNQVVAQFRKHLKPGTLIVVGGGYMGQRATKGCGKPPVLQMLLKELSLYFPILVVDEVSCPALLLVKPRCCPLMPDALRRSHTCSSSRQKCVRGARSEWRHRHVGASSASRATKR